MDEYKFVNPSGTVKAFTLPPAYPDSFVFKPPTLPPDWGDKGGRRPTKVRRYIQRMDNDNFDHNSNIGYHLRHL